MIETTQSHLLYSIETVDNTTKNTIIMKNIPDNLSTKRDIAIYPSIGPLGLSSVGVAPEMRHVTANWMVETPVTGPPYHAMGQCLTVITQMVGWKYCQSTLKTI